MNLTALMEWIYREEEDEGEGEGEDENEIKSEVLDAAVVDNSSLCEVTLLLELQFLL